LEAGKGCLSRSFVAHFRGFGATRWAMSTPGPPGIVVPEGADPLALWDEFLARVGVLDSQRNTTSAIEDPDGPDQGSSSSRSPKTKMAENRVHLDVRAAPGLDGEERMAALEAECDRLSRQVRKWWGGSLGG
jgi:hypothetical protein